MELWGLKVRIHRGILCTAHAQRAFSIFDGCTLWLLCHLGTGKLSFFSVSIALSCDVNNFVQGELFYFDDFYFIAGTFGKNPETPVEPPQYYQYPLALY